MKRYSRRTAASLLITLPLILFITCTFATTIMAFLLPSKRIVVRRVPSSPVNGITTIATALSETSTGSVCRSVSQQQPHCRRRLNSHSVAAATAAFPPPRRWTTTTTTTARHSPYCYCFSSLASSTSSWIENGEEDEHHKDMLIYEEDGTEQTFSSTPTSQERLRQLQQEIYRRTGNNQFNVKSPKQVSMAVFGKHQTCTKQVLLEAIRNPAVLSEQQRLLAILILQYKALLLQQEQQLENEEENTYQEDDDPNDDTGDEEQVLTQQQPTTKTEAPTPPSFVVTKNNPRERRRRLPTTTQQARMQSHEQIVDALFASPKCKIDSYWKQPLLELSRPVARELLYQLNSELCPVGYDPDATPQRKNSYFSSSSTSTKTTTNTGSNLTAGRKGSFLAFVRDQKLKYPQCVMLVRCGDFYETYGIDAILLVEHVGLNSMGGKVKAGCPYRNIQATLDGLTQQGFSVAVFEETGTVGGGSGSGGKSTSSTKLKDRILTQIVSPASPTYLYDNWLLEGNNASGGNNHQSLDGLQIGRAHV